MPSNPSRPPSPADGGKKTPDQRASPTPSMADLCAEINDLNTDANDQPITENPFENEGSRILFDAVEQMQSCGASQDIDVPQLVIVGGQSTGKSSLLQHLTDIPFPVGVGCCTRFATRIVSKRTAANTTNKFKISIVEPEVSVDEFNYGASTKYKDYALTGDVLTAGEFRDVIDEVAHNYLEIEEGVGADKKNFATQVLRIELSGPNRSHFNIVDIPGRIANPKGINEHEMRGVQSMVLRYIQKPDAIVICVGDASNDVSNQEVIHVAQKHAGDRFVGVFTKCDLVGNAEQFISLATKQGYLNNTGSPSDSWFVVCNRDRDSTSTKTPSETDILSAYPWNQIPRSRRGTSTLRNHLSTLLCARIRRNFPEIQKSIAAHLSSAQQRLADLGKPRPTHYDRQRYLGEVVQRYAALARDAVENPGMVDERFRVRTRVQALKELFADKMRAHGHTHQFEDPDMDPVAQLTAVIAEEQKEQKEKIAAAAAAAAAATMKNETSDFGRAVTPPPSMSGSPSRGGLFGGPPPAKMLFTFTPPSPAGSREKTKNKSTADKKAAEPLFDCIRTHLRAFQSTQLPGMVNPQVMPVLVREQTAKWQEISVEYLQMIHKQVSDTSVAILHEVCPQVRLPILHEELSAVLASQWQATAQANGLDLLRHCERETMGNGQHLDAAGSCKSFKRDLKALQTLRLLESMDSLKSSNWEESLMKKDIIFNQLHYSIEDNMAKSVHDILKVYYKMTLDSFILHVTKHIIEPFLCDPKGPLHALSMEWVYSLSESQVEKLAREDEGTIKRRKEEQAVIDRLQEALDIAQDAAERTRVLAY